MRKWFVIFALSLSVSAFADVEEDGTKSDFVSEERLEEGFLTQYLNRAMAREMERSHAPADADANSSVKPKFGSNITDYVSVPKIGGYFIGKFAYDSADGENFRTSFSQRLVRLYVDGTIFKYFVYRIQAQTNNESFHMKDYSIEWVRYPWLKVKIGQFKRAFGLENPLNPFDVGNCDYSQLSSKMTGHNDHIGAEASNVGGRDQGIQIQGDLFPIGKDRHKLLHYKLMVANGQGINAGDQNSRKDVMGTIQFQPIKGLIVGFFGWTGNFTDSRSKLTVDRNRWMISTEYNANNWIARAEYCHHQGHQIKSKTEKKDFGDGYELSKTTYSLSKSDVADAWYATVGIPCTKWLRTYVKYDVYRREATWDSMKTIYSITPNFQLHKNLMFQVQYNLVNDRTLAKPTHSELVVEAYVRF